MGHTAEPWQVEDRGNMAVSIVGMTRVEDRHWTGTCHYLGSLFMRSDMDRACLCVNALAGVEKPAEEVARWKRLELAAAAVVAAWTDNEIGQIDGLLIDDIVNALAAKGGE